MDAMIRGYAALGWEVTLLAMNTVRHHVPDGKLNTLYPPAVRFYAVEIDNTITQTGILKNLLFSREPEHVARFRRTAFANPLRVHLSQGSPDVVQLESPFLGSYIPLIRSIAPKAVLVYRAHNIEGQIWLRLATESRGLKARYLRILASRMQRYERQLWQDVDLILPITDVDAETITESGIKTPLQVAPFGIIPAEKDVALPPGPCKVYHIGAMDWLPNREAVSWFLEQVWPKVHEYAPELTFHFAGRAMPASFHENLPPGAFCEGEVADATAFAADKHILVVPLRAGSGIRVKTLEAMGAGKLVISTKVGMQGIEAESEAHYLSAEDAQMFSHLIAWASSHREKVESITWMAQRLIREKYDSREIMRRVDRVLKGMIGG